MELYVIRHGQTIWNSIGIIQGRTQNRLSELGKQQVQSASIELKDKGIEIIISSPLFRTVQTSNILNKNINVKIIKDKRIIENSQGIWTGRFKNSLTDKEKIKKKLRRKEDGCETHPEIFERIKSFVEDIKQNYPYKTILVVTHRTPARMIELALTQDHFSSEKFNTILGFDNAEFKHFSI